jgi:hypothetical protein
MTIREVVRKSCLLLLPWPVLVDLLFNPNILKDVRNFVYERTLRASRYSTRLRYLVRKTARQDSKKVRYETL